MLEFIGKVVEWLVKLIGILILLLLGVLAFTVLYGLGHIILAIILVVLILASPIIITSILIWVRRKLRKE